jgi:hypothetical protein
LEKTCRTEGGNMAVESLMNRVLDTLKGIALACRSLVRPSNSRAAPIRERSSGGGIYGVLISQD